MNEIFNIFIQFIAEQFGDVAAVTIGNGIGFNLALPLFAVAVFILNSLGVI